MRHAADFHQAVDDALAEIFADRETEFSLDDDAMVSIDFGDDVEVTLQAASETETILVFAQVCRIVGDGRDMACRALELNFFELSPLGAFLALDADRTSLNLCQAVGHGALSGKVLASRLAEFVAGVGAVRMRLARPAPRSLEPLPLGAAG